MSSSTERKIRAAAREAGTDKKMLAQQEAEKKAARSRRRWTVGSILVGILVILILLLNAGVQYKYLPALTVGETTYSPAQLNYVYNTQYYNFVSRYSSYLSLMGLDTSQGVHSLGSQSCPMLEEGKTWRDYFLQSAAQNLRQTTVLKNYAEANGITLSDAELADIDSQLASLTETAKTYNYPNVNRFLAAQYGTGVTLQTVRGLMIDDALATKAIEAYTASLTYSPEELEEYYASLNGSSDLFDFAYFIVPAAESSEDGAVSDTALLEARMTAEAIKMAYDDGYDIDDPIERFNAAIEAEYDADQATRADGVKGSNLSELSEWMTDASRKAGDVGVVASSDGDGYVVALFLARDDNHYATVNVRHILIKAEASEDGTYSDEAKAAALKKINEIKAEYEAGDKSEASFAALAEKYSDDEGSNTVGGLYENIYHGWSVEEFNDFCFGERKSGDVAIVYGESGSYAGYHLVYYVGEGELYSNVIARDALSSDAAEEFFSAEIAKVEPVLRSGAKLVG